MQVQNIDHLNSLTLSVESGDLELVYFHAPWSGPSIILSHVFDNMQTDLLLRVLSINVDEEIEIAQEWGIRVLPTMLLFRYGQLIDSRVGALPEHLIREWLDQHAT